MSIDVTYLKFNPKPLSLKFLVRLENWWNGVRDRKNTFKLFCQQLNIDYPPVPGKKYSVPDKYQVESDWIQYLGKLRDKVIMSKSAPYHNANKRVYVKIKEVQGQIEQEQQILAEFKNAYQTMSNKLKAEKAKKNHSHLEIISLESAYKNQGIRIANCKSDIAELETNLQILNDVIKSNNSSWHKQVDIVDALIQQTAKKYVHYATKKINECLNFTSFECVLPDYSDSVKLIMEN